ncbi:MAG: thiolase family protein [Candidatus Alcyoniella australis]|nr:thiolase family protein [Candidatus Alcyoniella australis]
MKEVWIVSAARTPIGSFGGVLKDKSAIELGVVAAKEAIKRAGVEPDVFQDVIAGQCMARSDELNMGRCIGLEAGLPFTVPGCTIQRQCSSSMQAMVFGGQQIMLEENDCVLIAGVEAMSRTPYVLYDMRWGARMWDKKVTDALMEGLADPLGHFMMGITAENLATKHNISREEQDELAYTSQTRAIAAIDAGRFKDEIVPVEVVTRKGTTIVDTDEHPRRGVTLEKLASLKPAFKKDGTVTAGNSSGINDGAAALVLMSPERAKELGCKPIAKLIGNAVAAVEPELMGYGPVPAVQKVLKKTGMDLKDMELIELNEAFAAQYLACEKLLGLDRDITNVNGSGVALGHPVGCTGIRIVISLLYEMARRDMSVGLASLCVGGGMGKAVIVERI